MRNPNFSSRAPDTGSVYDNGPLPLEIGDRKPKRDSTFRPDDKGGHNTASSTGGGTNGKNNIVPQSCNI